MCHHCNYTQLLEDSGLGATANRLGVLEIVGNNTSPLSAQEIFDTISRTQNINRVTVYRILDLLVENGLVERLSGGGRAFYYGLAPNEHHQRHPHFYCRQCGHLECLNPNSLSVDLDSVNRSFPGRIDSMEVRLDGICKTCLRQTKKVS